MRQLINRSVLLLLALVCSFMHTAHGYADSLRTVTPSQWHKLTNDKVFNYKTLREPVAKPREPGLFDGVFERLFALLSGNLGYVLLWVIVIAVISFIIYRIVSSDSFFFSKKSKKVTGTEGQDTEDITNTNWESLLQQALAQKDLRMAVRYRYMWLLQLLQQRELILYRTDKTNYEYYTELSGSPYKQPFRQLTRQYEYAWYGSYALSETAYHEYQDLFNDLKKQLKA